MFFSDEPGYYEDGNFGIRLETILKVATFNGGEGDAYGILLKIFWNIFTWIDQWFHLLGDFIQFEPVTLVPFEPKLIDYSLMTVKQIEWLNDYNEIIINRISTRIDKDDLRTLDWIDTRTKFINPVRSNEVQKWKSELIWAKPPKRSQVSGANL